MSRPHGFPRRVIITSSPSLRPLSISLALALNSLTLYVATSDTFEVVTKKKTCDPMLPPNHQVAQYRTLGSVIGAHRRDQVERMDWLASWQDSELATNKAISALQYHTSYHSWRTELHGSARGITA